MCGNAANVCVCLLQGSSSAVTIPPIGHGSRGECFPGAGWAVEEHSLWGVDAEVNETVRVQKRQFNNLTNSKPARWHMTSQRTEESFLTSALF